MKYEKYLILTIVLVVIAMFVVSGCSSGEAFRKASKDGSLSRRCIDTDETKNNGVNPFVFGQVSGDFGKFADECVNNDSLNEYYCYDNNAEFQVINCKELGYELGKDYICENGACISIPCTDSDGGKDYYVKGITSGRLPAAGAVYGNQTDYCEDMISPNNLREFYCEYSNQLGIYFVSVEDVNCEDLDENYICEDGACVVDNSSDPLYPEHFITDGEFNGLFVIGATASTHDVIYLMDIVADMNSYASVPAGSTVLDTEVSSISEQNIIAVGTACDNTIIYDLIGNPESCSNYEQQGIGLIKAFETDDDIYALIVDGYGFAEREAAKVVLLNWEDYADDFDSRIGAVCVDINNDYSVGYC